MGLSVVLSNALAGMNITQSGLNVLSRNVSGAGTPGYHRQSLVIVDSQGSFSAFARIAGLQRAFNEALQIQYSNQISETSAAAIKTDFLKRLETSLGLPGDAFSLDTLYTEFQNSMAALALSPDDYPTRAQALVKAQDLVETLNSLTGTVQDLRRETESQIKNYVNDANRILTSLADINQQLFDFSQDEVVRSALMDERDRLVGSMAEIIDIRVDYREDGTVALMTKSGLGLLDVSVSIFEFDSAGALSANALFSNDDAENGVGVLRLRTSSGLDLDLVEQGILQSGALGALVGLRDSTLVQVQGQLDEIAANLALALSTIETDGTAITVGVAVGFELDLSDVQAGNSFLLTYTESGQEKLVKVVRVDDTSKLPMDYTDSNGVRVVGLDFSSGVSGVATSLSTALGTGLTITNPSGSILRIVDDGGLGTTDVSAMVAHTTVTANQDAGLALNLFVDYANLSFTGSLDGDPQRRGFAGRISINRDLLADNSLLVQYASGGSLGDSARADFFVSQLEDLKFISDVIATPDLGSFRMNGNIQDFVAQFLNFQGGAISRSENQLQTKQLTMDALNLRLTEEYGVNIDEEMANLMELQNAYSANARVISIVQELLRTLMQI